MNRVFPRFRNFERRGQKMPRVNWMIAVCMAGLLTFGVLFIKSATSIRTDSVHYIYLEMMFKWIPLGLAAHIFIAAVDYRKWLRFSLIPYAGGVLLLVLVLLFGTKLMGARRWIFGVQPSEFMKLAVIPAAAFILANFSDVRGSARFAVILGIFGIPALLVAIQQDLGSAMAFVPACAAMLYVSGCSKTLFRTMMTLGIFMVTVFFSAILLPEHLPEGKREAVEEAVDKFIFPHWRKRVEVFVFPDRDPLGAGWNKRQSEIAVGSGGRFGKGYLKGTQNILGFLPRSVSSTDFIFSVIGEETGFVGSCSLILLFCGLLGGIVATGYVCRDPAGRLICTGTAALLFMHIFVNMAMTVGKMPITGIPLPLVSYGGSFTVAIMSLLGLVQSVSIHGSESTPGGGQSLTKGT